MTRELLLEYICPTDYTDVCVLVGCEHCEVKLNEWLDEYDKQIRAKAINDYYNTLNEKINTDTNLKDTIREIHDNVAKEMYCKGVDDFVEKVELKYLGVNPDELYEKYYPREICEQIKEIAKQLKAGGTE